MSDERVRALERRFRETGALEDEAAWLSERVRAGSLERERLELAAYLDHEAALLALGIEAKPVTDLEEWARGFQRWGREACVRLGIALSRLWESSWTPGGLSQQATQAAEAWLDCPCESHAEEARRIAEAIEANEVVGPFEEHSGPAEAAAWMAAMGNEEWNTAWAVRSTRLPRGRDLRAAVCTRLVPWALDVSA